jgi:periplasmic divalent cation tolerance protein
MSQIQFVYITTANIEEAQRIGNTLVEERLAACVNIFENMKSIYRWKSKIETATEVVVIAKTRKTLVAKLIKRVEKLHSYDTPCALAFSISKGSSKYVKWLLDETKSRRSNK